MNDAEIVEWVIQYESSHEDDDSLENLLKAFQKELLRRIVKKLGDKS